MGVVALGAVVLALGLDVLFEEPPKWLHPVAWFGRVVGHFDRAWPHPRAVGSGVAVLLPAGAAAIAGGLVVLTPDDPYLAVAVVGLVVFVTTSFRMLLSTARTVVETTESDLATARGAVRALVGRDSSTLSPDQIRSAVVESLAENLADGLVAPLFAFVVGAQFAPAVAAAAAVWVKAVNTLDSMLGYRSKPVGWASARLDDAVMWLPARVTAVLIALAGAMPTAPIRARTWADRPPSPNSGWPMATLAAVLGVRLAKPGAYDLNPGASLPGPAESRRAVRVIGVAGLLSYLMAGVIAWS